MPQATLEALRRGDYAAAAEAARHLLQTEPDNADGHHLLGLALRALGDLEAAQQSLDRAISLAPTNAVFHVSRATAAMREARLDEAQAALDEAIKHDPNQLAAYVTLAHIALARRDLDEAERQLKLVLRVDPDHPYALVVQGNVALARGQHDQALAHVSRAASFAPEDPMVLSALGLAYLAKGHFAFAEQALRNAVAKQPEARRLRWALVEALRRQGRLLDALPEVRELHQADPADTAAAVLHGELVLASGRTDEALAIWRDFIAQAADPAPAVVRTAQRLVGAGLHAPAVELLEEALARVPGNDALWALRVGLASEGPASWKPVLDRWLRENPDSLNAREYLAQYHEAVGEDARAEEIADAILAEQPARQAALSVKLRADLRERPEAVLERVVPLLDDAMPPLTRRVAHGWRGLALDRLGRHDEAIASWREMGSQPVVGLMPVPPVVFSTRQTAESDSDGPAPRLLWGAPGSGVERIAAALVSSPDCIVLSDRFGPGARPDGLWPPRADEGMVDVKGWRGLLASLGVDPARAIDWLPHWDARAVAALPDARLIAVIRDPRDMLLDWWVYGSTQRFAFPEPGLAATWLANALRPLVERMEAAPDKVELVRADADPEALCTALAGTLQLAQAPDPQAIRAAGRGPGGLPTAFPVGHWRHYAQALAEPFAELEGIAARLGY